MSHLIQFLMWNSCLVLFLAAFAEQSGVPLPAAPLLIAAGAMAANGKLNIVLAIACTTLACLAADAFWFYAGHRGKDRLVPFFTRLRGSKPSRPRTAGARATLRGIRILTVAKFLPLGTLAPLRAGMLDISPLRFVLHDLPPALIYGSVYPLLGFYFHDQLRQATAILHGLGIAGVLFVLVMAGVYAGLVIRHHGVRAVSTKGADAAISDLPSQDQIPAPTKS